MVLYMHSNGFGFQAFQWLRLCKPKWLSLMYVLLILHCYCLCAFIVKGVQHQQCSANAQYKFNGLQLCK